MWNRFPKAAQSLQKLIHIAAIPIARECPGIHEFGTAERELNLNEEDE